VSFTLNFNKCNKILGDSKIAKDYGSRIGFMCDVGLLNFLLSFRKAGQSGNQTLVGARFSTPIQPPLQRVLGFFPGGIKCLGCGVGHSPPSTAKVKERVELYLYSPTGPSLPVLVNFITIQKTADSGAGFTIINRITVYMISTQHIPSSPMHYSEILVLASLPKLFSNLSPFLPDFLKFFPA